MKRRGLKAFSTAALFCGALVLGTAAAPTAAWASQDSPTENQEADSKKKDRQAAKEARIAEYLRKREERRIRREQRAVEQEATRKAAAEQAERKRLADAESAEKEKLEKAYAAEVASAERAARTGKKRGKDGKPAIRSKLPRGLAKAQEAVRNSRLGQDPSVQRYLELVEQQEASPQQLGAIGNFLAQAGMGREALAYYDVALNLDKRDPVLWINAGTLHRQAGRTGQAISAYMRALSIDTNNAVAHYNLGACFDSQGKYENALEEYKIALRLDPDLGDPAVNPQAANNEHLIAVKLLLYQEQSGSLGIPLIDVPGGDLTAPEEKQN